MNNENRKIVKYDPNTGAPIYEEIPTQIQSEQTVTPAPSVQSEPVVDNSRFQPQQNNSFEQQVVNQVNNQQQYQQPTMNQSNYQQSMMNQYQQPVQQPMMNQNNYQQPMMQQMPMQQPQNNLNQTSYQQNYESKKSNKGLIIGIIVGIIVLVAVVVIGYFIFFDGKNDKKSDDTNSKPTTTINDYDDPTPTPEPDPEPEKPTTSSDYISYGHLKYKKYPGYTYTNDGSVLKVKFNKNGLINIYETTSTELQSYMETDEDFKNYLLDEIGADAVDEMYTFEKDTYKYMIVFIEHDGGTFIYFCSTTPSSYYYVEGLMSDPDATSINTVLDALENVLSNIEK